MLEQTATVAALLRSIGDIRQQVRHLAGAYEGADCVIVTCGPSLAEHDPERLRSALRGRLVFAVKQAIDVVGVEADFLCFNAYNASRFEPPSAETVLVFAEDAERSVSQLNTPDVVFPALAHGRDLADSLAASRDYEAAMISHTLARPWGPGILHELVFPLAVHVGVRRVTTIGWDIANQSGNNVHFYDRGDAFFDKGRADAYRLVGLRKRLPAPVRQILRSARSQVKHRSGGLYNRTTMIQGEAELVASSIPALSDWLEAHGIALEIVSDSPLFGDGLTRVARNEFYGSSD